MIHETLVVGPVQCNCAILGCEKTRAGILIDPGDEAPRILAKVKELGLDIKYILHTHAHFDHIAGTGGVKEKLDAPTCLHRGDEMIYNNLPMQGKLFGMQFESAPPIERFVLDEEILTFGEYKLQVIHTPGHSPGSVCYKISGPSEALFAGDTLFQGSVGRTDLWGADQDTMIRSIKERIFALEDDLPVHPGHGPSTKIGIEKRTNPFLI